METAEILDINFSGIMICILFIAAALTIILKLNGKENILNRIIFVSALIILLVSFASGDLPVEETCMYENGEIIIYSWRNNFEFYFGYFVFSLFGLFGIAALISIIKCLIIKMKNNQEMILKRIAVSLGIYFISCVIAAFSNLLVQGIWDKEDYAPVCYEFSDGRQRIVIEECSFLLLGYANVYQIFENNHAVLVGELGTDDGGRNRGKYDIEWHSDYIEITYNTFNSPDSKLTQRIDFTD